MTVEPDKNFFKAWPFGVLKTIHWLAPFAVLVTIWLGPYTYTSVGFVLFTSWNAFIICFITFLCYVFGLHRMNFQFGGGYMYIPFALIDFIVACLGVLFYGISSLICIISVVDGLNYRASVVFTYLFATVCQIFCLISGAAFGYFAVLVYRNLQNGQFRYLPSMIIEGERIKPMDELPGPGPAAAHPNAQPAPGWRPTA